MTFAGGYAVTFLSAMTLAGSPTAQACGYHDPTSMNRGMLNWIYPKALYVNTAVWMAQRDGIIARDDQPETMRRLLGYQRLVTKLSALRDSLARAVDGGAAPAFSMVLLGPMLWSRYEASGGAVAMTPHVDGPSNDDVVIVSDEPVIAGLLEGRLTPAAARDLGLMRFYGEPERVKQLTSWLDRLPAQSRADAIKIGQ